MSGALKLVRRADQTVVIDSGLLNVQLDPSLTEGECEAILAREGLELLNKLRFAKNLYETRAVGHEDAMAASVALHGNDDIVFAEPAFVEHIPLRAAPTDPDYGDQWQWENDGSGGGTAGADVSAEAAWDHTLGADVRVAVIDNGFDADHEDLDAGVGGQSGYFSASAPAGFTQGTTGMPGSNHGTFCAGMVGARRNNGRGGVGAAPACEFTLVACLGDQVGTQTTLARAVAYAADPSTEVAGEDPANGADIIVSSLGPNGAVWNLTATLDLALQNAATNGRGGRGVCIFWAASNGNNVDVTLDEVVSHDDVIAVVRSTNQDFEGNAARGDTVELIAPGVDVYSTQSGDGYGTSTGTSFAAPCAAGCAALALSVNTDLTRDELRQVMRDTADKVGGVVYDLAGHNDDYGFGRVNAEEAVLAAALRVELETASLVFADVPELETTARAVVWHCFGLESLTFEVVSGPSGPFSALLGTSVTIPAPGVTTGERARLWCSYGGTTAGAMASGSVTVRCVQTGEEWVVPISANTIARPTAAVLMVLDQSGSMDFDAGDGRRRVEVLQEAAQNFVDVLQPETGVGVVRFDHDAYGAMAIQDAGPEIFGPGRAAAAAAVASHAPNPLGATSIGDGVEMAGGMLDGVAASHDVTAMVVLTDGQENASKFISDVAGSIDDRVYAIGLGTPETVDPDKLTDLTNGSGGYVVMTGALSQDEYFILSKYYLQILAGATNEEVVLDPSGYLQPTRRTAIPFSITEADAGSDVILLCPAPSAMRMTLEAPTGLTIAPSSGAPGVTFAAGRGVAYYRLTLPVVGPAGDAAWAGRWVAHLECDRVAFSKYLNSIEDHPKAYAHAQAHGLRYAVEVHSRSSLRMTTSLTRKENAPGTPLRITARLSEYGMPVERRARVVAQITSSGGSQTVRLDEGAPGAFEAETTAQVEGTYRVRIVGEGKTLRGSRFTREQTRTTSIYTPRPPEDPKPPPDRPDELCAKVFVALLRVLERDRRLAGAVERALRLERVDLQQLLLCLKKAGGRSTERPPGDTGPGVGGPPASPPGHGRVQEVIEGLRHLADSLEHE